MLVFPGMSRKQRKQQINAHNMDKSQLVEGRPDNINGCVTFSMK